MVLKRDLSFPGKWKFANTISNMPENTRQASMLVAECHVHTYKMLMYIMDATYIDVAIFI